MTEERVKTIVLGAGLSGLGASLASGFPVYEATDQPGGVCHSYYLDEGHVRRNPDVGDVCQCFRFEPAGGHWLFGVSAASRKKLEGFCPLKEYARRAAVFFPQSGALVPYPLQDCLRYFEDTLRDRILHEVCSERSGIPQPSGSFKDWLLANFGRTLCDLFFFPFNEQYTCGLYADIAPQDLYKSVVDKERMRRGAFEDSPSHGYNSVFLYPSGGLDRLVRAMSATCDIHFDHRVVRIDTSGRKVYFENGAVRSYDKIISTIPLHTMSQLCGIDCGQIQDPSTAVLVVNIGAMKGINCPPYHWVYLPSSKSGIHRVGFYSHVDRSFLPQRYRGDDRVVSLYAEKSFPSDFLLSAEVKAETCVAIVEELKEWDFIGTPLVIDSTYTNPAYTWSRPGSSWAPTAIRELGSRGIHQIGRYGAWRFQGMMESFEEGLSAGQTMAQ